MSDLSGETKSAASPVEPAEIVREYGPYPGADRVNGVTYDGERIWFAAGDKLRALDPKTGAEVRAIDVVCEAGTAFDGEHFYQITGGRIDRIDPVSGGVVSSFDAPGKTDAAGLTWAEGTLWVAQHRGRKIIQIDASDGTILRTLESDRFVTGVTFAEGELWHGTGDDGQPTELRQIDTESGRVRMRLAMPAGSTVSGVESNGTDLLFCGGGRSGRLRAVRRPKRTG
jgi:glutamine cyclotransferase